MKFILRFLNEVMDAALYSTRRSGVKDHHLPNLASDYNFPGTQQTPKTKISGNHLGQNPD